MQGFNMGRYIPPDDNNDKPTIFNKSHPLGSRARKLKTEGILTVRFELPFTIWCTTCKPEEIIGQGVRFNAEKKKLGSYHSTIIWSFRFKHTICGGWIEIKTDPQNAEYVVIDGARKRDYGENHDPIFPTVNKEEIDIFENLEKKVEDKKVYNTQKERIETLIKNQDKNWNDPYLMSQKIRREFRVGRRKRQDDDRTGKKLQEKFGLDFDISVLKDEDDDVKRMKYLDFGLSNEGDLDRDMFDDDKAKIKRNKKNDLQNKLRGNTRKSIDPFLNGQQQQPQRQPTWMPKTKRKKKVEGEDDEKEEEEGEDRSVSTQRPSLVDYNSDSS